MQVTSAQSMAATAARRYRRSARACRRRRESDGPRSRILVPSASAHAPGGGGGQSCIRSASVARRRAGGPAGRRTGRRSVFGRRDRPPRTRAHPPAPSALEAARVQAASYAWSRTKVSRRSGAIECMPPPRRGLLQTSDFRMLTGQRLFLVHRPFRRRSRRQAVGVASPLVRGRYSRERLEAILTGLFRGHVPRCTLPTCRPFSPA